MAVSAVADIVVARDLMARLGLAEMSAHTRRSFATRDRWLHVSWPFGPRAMASALGGGCELAASGLSTVRHLTIDIDAHAAKPDTGAMCLDGALSLSGKERAKLQRAAVAGQLFGTVARVRELWPQVVIEGSRRGVHADLILESEADADEVSRINAHVLEELGHPPNVEIFPRATHDGKLTCCRTPLCGPAGRVLNEELTGPLYTRRSQDREHLLSAKTVPVSSLLPPATTRVVAEESSQATPSLDTATTLWSDDGVGQLRGLEWVEFHLDLLEAGIPAGRSWAATRKVAYLLRSAAGLDERTSIAGFTRWIELPIHRANHCATTAGRRELVRTFCACLRHQRRGIESGVVRPAELRHPALRDAVRQLCRRIGSKR